MKRHAAILGCCLSLGFSNGCLGPDEGDDTRDVVEVLIGAEPLVLDAREVLTANGEFTVTAEASGGSVSVSGELVEYTPDSDLGYGSVRLTGSAPTGDSVEAVVRIYNAPDVFRFSGVINDADPEPHAQFMTAYSGAVRGDQFGEKIFDAGDWNGDGYDDFLVVASLANRPFVDQGALYLLEGGDNGPRGPFLLVEGQGPNDRLGRRARAADLDGDGLTDIVYPNRSLEQQDTSIVIWGASLEDGVSLEQLDPVDEVVRFAADLDGDGRAELGMFGASEGSQGWRVYRGAAREEVATEPVFSLGCDLSRRESVLGDVSSDGDGVEVAYRCADTTTVVSGVPGEPLAVFEGSVHPTQGVGDLDGDGLHELIVLDDDSGDAYVEFGGLLAAREAGCSETRLSLPSSTWVLSTTKDVDQDGIRDLVYSRGGSEDATGWDVGLWLSSKATCDPLADATGFPGFSDGIRTALSRDIDGDAEEELLLGVLAGAGHVVTFDMP